MNSKDFKEYKKKALAEFDEIAAKSTDSLNNYLKTMNNVVMMVHHIAQANAIAATTTTKKDLKRTKFNQHIIEAAELCGMFE